MSSCGISCPYYWHDDDCGYCSIRGNEILDLKNYSYSTCEYYKEYEASRKSSGSSSGNSNGCYVATAVYGSYDCPQVWTLRRYRDDVLASKWYGRAFIRVYYRVSPVLVKWFGRASWFRRLWKRRLDRMTEKLNAKGIKNTPYKDKRLF